MIQPKQLFILLVPLSCHAQVAQVAAGSECNPQNSYHLVLVSDAGAAEEWPEVLVTEHLDASGSWQVLNTPWGLMVFDDTALPENR